MNKKISPDEIAKIEQELKDSSLDEGSISLIKGLIAGQSFLLKLIEKLVTSSGYQRIKIIKELAKIVDINLKKKEDYPPDDPLGDNAIDNSSEDNNLIDSSNKDKSQPSPFPEESQTKDGGLPEDEALQNTDESSKDEGENGEDPPKRQHPKRGNDEFNPVKSHVHHHENLEPGDLCPECLKGKVYPFREKVIPVLIGRSPLAYEEHRLQTLRCNACGALFEPKLPKEIPKVGNSSASAQAVLTFLHYQIGVPFASVSDFQKMFKQEVSPAQLWNAVEQAARAVEPIYQELEKVASNSKLFYTDDTTARILTHYPINKENREKKGRNKDPCDRVGTYSSLIIGCTPDSHQIYLFYHGRKYAGENLADLLKSRDKSLGAPLQMRDASMMNVAEDTEVIDSKCNAHAIRKFKDIREIYPNECAEVLHRYDKVNKIDQMLLKKGVSDSERLAYHKKHGLPIMEGIKNYLKGLIDDKIIEPKQLTWPSYSLEA